MWSYWLRGALCRPPSNAAGSTVYEMLAAFPITAVALPVMPGIAADSNGVSICQHSRVEALLAAPMAVMFRDSAGTSVALASTKTRECILFILSSDFELVEQRNQNADVFECIMVEGLRRTVDDPGVRDLSRAQAGDTTDE